MLRWMYSSTPDSNSVKIIRYNIMAGKGDKPRSCFSTQFRSNYNLVCWTKQIFLFDVDGTLTTPRTKMLPRHAALFSSWMDNKTVYLVTGSDLPKTQQQVDAHILDSVDGIFCSMANELYQGGNVIYRNKLNLPDDIYKWLNGQLCGSSCPEQYRETKHYEMRNGMLNFSICGRDVSEEQRKKYTKWDNNCKNRETIVKQFNAQFNTEGYEARLGGEISIDIQELGSNKRLAIEWVSKQHKDAELIYFGDRCYEGGNDYDACKAIDNSNLGAWHSVKGPLDTMKLIKGY